ncbi:MAG: hypothetical protein EPO68_03895, partial [Planctomycetota bacterium]
MSAAGAEPDQGSHARDRSRWRALASSPWVALALVLALACLAYGRTLSYEVLGHDAWALVDAARIGSWRELAAPFHEPFMDGRFGVAYFRPIQSVFYALDYALSGLDPHGYQISGLLAFLACCTALYLLARRCLGGSAAALPALVAALGFVLYAGHWEVIPMLERRHEMLAGSFAAFALFAQLSPARLALGRPSWIAGLLAFGAMGSKEAGAIVAPIAFVCAVAYSGAGAGRVRRVVIACVPFFCATLLFTALRVNAIGGVGGERWDQPLTLANMLDVVEKTLLPQPDFRV